MSHIYNSLPHINEAAKRLPSLQSSVLPELKALLVEYQVEPLFGIVFIHRHFELEGDDEQVVDLTGPKTVVSSVFQNGRPDTRVVEEYGLDVPDSYSIVPARYLVREDLIPYEYKCVSKEEEFQFKEHMDNLPIQFIQQWRVILEENGARDTMGLVDLSTETAIDGFEISDAERRVNVITATPDVLEAMEYVPSVWQSQLEKPVRSCGCQCGGALPELPPVPNPIIRIETLAEIGNEGSLTDRN
jgi:hypothetical protein